MDTPHGFTSYGARIGSFETQAAKKTATKKESTNTTEEKQPLDEQFSKKCPISGEAANRVVLRTIISSSIPFFFYYSGATTYQ
ncbi:MAG TPA: hypothetical protein VNG51_10750 [Ktedonobacteraceae bacterium]|nr:hypothetical protein [Ktedonobacteraceae bacterium]